MRENLTLAETATRLGRNVELVRLWAVSGRLPARKFGRMWAVSARDLATFEKRAPIRRTWSAAAKKRARRRRAERKEA